MCTYVTVNVALQGSAKGPAGEWFRANEAAVYFDHPVHAVADHTLNVDIPVPGNELGHRVALELTASSARALVAAIEEALAAAPEALTA